VKSLIASIISFLSFDKKIFILCLYLIYITKTPPDGCSYHRTFIYDPTKLGEYKSPNVTSALVVSANIV
jgi:hypothetical protein